MVHHMLAAGVLAKAGELNSPPVFKVMYCCSNIAGKKLNWRCTQTLLQAPNLQDHVCAVQHSCCMSPAAGSSSGSQLKDWESWRQGSCQGLLSRSEEGL